MCGKPMQKGEPRVCVARIATPLWFDQAPDLVVYDSSAVTHLICQPIRVHVVAMMCALEQTIGDESARIVTKVFHQCVIHS
jgi:hypothetical protein